MSSWNNAAKVSPAPAFTSSANLGEVEWIPRLPESYQTWQQWHQHQLQHLS